MLEKVQYYFLTTDLPIALKLMKTIEYLYHKQKLSSESFIKIEHMSLLNFFQSMFNVIGKQALFLPFDKLGT